MARIFLLPAMLIVVVWCLDLTSVAIGPIDYPMQPSSVVLAVVAAGISLFVLAHWAGARFFGSRSRCRPDWPAPSPGTLNRGVIVSSLIGIGGIGLIALDRLVLSGISNGGYSALLRCAPDLVDIIEIKRTPALYFGYLTFSFSFVSLALLLLKGEEIGGGAAILGQLSIVSPVGYALLYSGRMPILFVIVLTVSAMLARFGQGRRLLPEGRHLFLKMAAVLVLFAVYSSAMWSSRQNFCSDMSGLIRQLQQRMHERDPGQAAALQPRWVQPERPQAEPSMQRNSTIRSAEQDAVPQKNPAAGEFAVSSAVPQSSALQPSPEKISAAELNKLVAAIKAGPVRASTEASGFLATMRESWSAQPRAYMMAAIDSGRLSPRTAMNLLSTYFYLTHGVRVIDTTWRARELFTPRWGLYEVGVLSPVLRVFFPQSQALPEMGAQLRAAGIGGFFPTVWVAAYIDFGIVGGIIYILIWGCAAGWSAAGTRSSAFATPQLLLVFILASIFLSPVQGPLGIANSALVLFSMLVTGIAIDLASLRTSFRQTVPVPRVLA
jgi:hypothetical protein